MLIESFSVQVLDSLDAEGNMGTKQDAISSRTCSVDRCPDDKDSYRLDIQGESCLGCLENSKRWAECPG